MFSTHVDLETFLVVEALVRTDRAGEREFVLVDSGRV